MSDAFAVIAVVFGVIAVVANLVSLYHILKYERLVKRRSR